MEKKNKIEDIIGGRVYTLVGKEPEEYIQRVALYIDKKMSEIKKAESSRKLSTSMIATLTSINVADDLFKLIEKINSSDIKVEALEDELKEKDKQLQVYQKELREIQQENTTLKNKLHELQLEIKKSELELEEYINIFDSSLKNNNITGDK